MSRSRLRRAGGRHTFAEDHSFSDGAIALIARICKDSVSTFKERQIMGRKYFVALVQAQVNAGEKVSEDQINEINKLKVEIEAEQKGGTVERG